MPSLVLIKTKLLFRKVIENLSLESLRQKASQYKISKEAVDAMNNEIIVRGIMILLNRFAYDFTPEQRSDIMDILSENQPL